MFCMMVMDLMHEVELNVWIAVFIHLLCILDCVDETLKHELDRWHSHAPTAATPAAMHAPSRTLPPGIPMDINRTRTLKPLVQTCYRCGQTGHISRDCDLRHDIRHMMLDKQDNFIQQIMANRDAAMAAAAESTTQMGTSKGTLVEREADNSYFVRSSR
jgi:hypothetical protein